MATPRFWVHVNVMSPNTRQFHQRYEGRLWRPPRPRGSNLTDPTAGRWYEFSDDVLRPSDQPWNAVPFKKHSLYYCDDGIWVYRGDASRSMVGDGSENPRIDARNVQLDDSDDDSGEDDGWDDWKKLEFTYMADTTIPRPSFATTRASAGPRVHNHYHASRAVEELLPAAHHALPAQQHPFPGRGGFNGDLSILLGLTALGVAPNNIPYALCRSFHQQYVPNYLQRDGWTREHGVIVRTFYEETPQHLLPNHGQPPDPNFLRLIAFEGSFTATFAS